MKKFLLCLLMTASLVLLLVSPAVATSDLHIIKYAPDGTTVLGEKTVNISWMEENLPVLGDGVTHYYMQGPTFDEDDYWDPSETKNVESRDFGALKGTDIRDLCELAGGMSEDDTLRIISEDGFYKTFPYENIYEPQARQGPGVICWYNGAGPETEEGEEQGVGYPPDYYMGMRFVFFADTSVNPDGRHVFGNTDMKECLDEKYWHKFNGEWPSTGGLSVKYVSDIKIKQAEGATPTDTTAASEPAATATQQSPLPLWTAFGALGAVLLLRRFTI